MGIMILTVVLIVDQLTKNWALNSLKPLRDLPVIQNIFHLTYVENRGAAFGMLQNQKLFFIITTLLVVGGVLIFMIKNKNNMHILLKISLSLIVGGALGNFLDRIRHGFVVDFFRIAWFDFPVFNVADSAIVVGAILVSYYVIKYDSVKTKEM
ncbi:signal peptidase II [Alkaliphilus crotonatoxidans]